MTILDEESKQQCLPDQTSEGMTHLDVFEENPVLLLKLMKNERWDEG